MLEGKHRLKILEESLELLKNWDYQKENIDIINDSIFDSNNAIIYEELGELNYRLISLRAEFHAVFETFEDDSLSESEKLEDLIDSQEMVVFILEKTIYSLKRKILNGRL